MTFLLRGPSAAVGRLPRRGVPSCGPGTSYLLSPGAEISFTDRNRRETCVTVGYEVNENDGIGGLGEMLARAMAAQASDEVKAKLDDVF